MHNHTFRDICTHIYEYVYVRMYKSFCSVFTRDAGSVIIAYFELSNVSYI